MTVERVWLFNCGWIDVEGSLLMYRQDFGNRRTIPVTATLVKSTEGYFLFDTGLNVDAVTDPDGALGAKAGALVDFDEEHGILAHLDSVGIGPSDIRWMTNSHLHWDHTGGNACIDADEVLVQREELRFAHDPDAFVSQIYLQKQYGLPEDVTVIDGDHVVTDGIGLISTRGHTPGHQSLLVRLPSGRTILCAGDAAYSHANVDESWPPGNAWSMPDAYRSLRRMGFEQNFTNAELVIGHDPDLWSRDGERIKELH
ncbi:N-acyl homoserine lactonase family protein [Microbacterium sp. A93]|uniref:N-acyl homoserine lactonase family protein n=1 Tax=unclassified Microbacterium TaxID=2609290 RepID=UPI003F41C393